jgi:hypothetical protein
MFNERTTLVLANATISGNTASNGGGGMSANESPSLVLINVIISGNIAGNGGGIRNDYHSSLVLINVTIAGNNASGTFDGGGGINNTDDSNLALWNSIIWGNTAVSSMGIKNGSGTIGIAHSIVQDSGGSGSDSWNTSLGTDNGNNLDTNPLFIAPDPVAAGSPKTGGDYRLSSDSPAINAGINDRYPSIDDDIFSAITDADVRAAITAALAKDRAGNTRIQGGTIDMGAYEKE